MGQLNHDGVALAFEDVGKGAPPILLVHDLACDRTSFVPQIERFRHNHRVLPVDLRGRGQNGKPESDYSIASLADALVWLCYELGVHRPVIIGHGLGVLIALDLAARHTDFPEAIVTLDTPILPSPERHVLLKSFPRVPILYVDGGGQTTDLDALRELFHSLIVNRLVGGGHFPQLLKADQVNMALDHFIGQLTDGTSDARLPHAL